MTSFEHFWIRMAGVVGVATPFVTFSAILTSVVLSPWFSWRTNALSDLGVRMDVGLLFNFGLIAGGILLLLFTSGIFLVMKRTATRIGIIILVLAAISLISIGIFPENVGRPHLYASMSFFILTPLAQLTIGMSMLKDTNNRISGMFSVIIAVASVFVWSLPIERAAIPETMSSVLGSLWLIVFGFKTCKQTL